VIDAVGNGVSETKMDYREDWAMKFKNEGEGLFGKCYIQ